MKRANRQYDVFISYRRDGSEDLARNIRDRLDYLGYRVFFDVESMRAVNFNTELLSVIENCQDMIVVLPPNGLDRCVNEDDWVRQEIQHALAHGKNVVPIMMRGFEFPAVLPPSLEPLRYRNGLVPSPQTYDAFIIKLTEFLEAKPVQRHRYLKRGLLAAAALLLAAAITFGLWFMGQYPRTRTEENLTQEAIACVGRNMVCYDMLVKSQEEALETVQLFLDGKEADRDTALWMLTAARQKIQTTDLSEAELGQDFVTRLESSRFASAEFIAMYQQLVSFRQEGLQILDHMEFLVSPECTMSSIEKGKTLNAYKVYLEENGKAFAYCTNQMLLPVTRDGALEMLWKDIMPTINHVPLDADKWMEDEQLLETAIAECLQKMEESLQINQQVLDSMTHKMEEDKEKTRAMLMEQGYTPAGADRIVRDMVFDYELAKEDQIEKYIRKGCLEADARSLAEKEIQLLQIRAEARKKYSPLIQDSWDVLWAKMKLLLVCDLFPESRECVDLYEVAAVDKTVSEYLPAVRLFIDQAEAGAVEHGLIVVEHGEGEINTLLQVGDIILAVDGRPCDYLESYVDYKNEAGNDYTMTVLRRNSAGALEQLELNMTKDMTPVYYYALLTK